MGVSEQGVYFVRAADHWCRSLSLIPRGNKAPMSRRGSPLVGYAGSDDEDVEVEPEGPPKKKR